MKNKRSVGLTEKMVWVFLILGMIPLGVLAWITIQASHGLTEGTGQSLQRAATNINKLIERNLFERYGNVQAFAANDVLKQRDSWYQVGSATNHIAAAANTYVALYGIYPLCLVVDIEGRVLAVNDRNAKGEAIETDWVYERNFKSAKWFGETMAGNFLTSDTLTGTYVEDVFMDADVQKITGGSGLVVTYSAPIKDTDGTTIGVWHNFADFALVEEIIADAYQSLQAEDFSKAEVTLIDRTGRVLVDFDPASSGGTLEPNRDTSVVLQLNLVELGVEAAKHVVARKSGWDFTRHVRKQINQVAGFSASQGALGYPGLQWGVMVRVAESEALASAHSIRKRTYWVLALAGLGLLLAGGLLGRRITAPIVSQLQALNEAGEQVAAASAELASASQTLAEGASEQAASLEETGASLEEMTSMVKRNAEAAQRAKLLASETRTEADTGANDMQALQKAMHDIRDSSGEIAKIVKNIDEIAFQTNILALNAAVEAARAGEAGAGFSVVANEVRNLAHRSATAARETADKIEIAIKNSDRGVKLSSKVSGGLEQIVEKIRQVDQYVSEIACASSQQAQGVEQVNLAVTEMDKVTQSNAASSEESAAAAEELSSQAQAVKETVQSLQLYVQGRPKEGSTGNMPSARSPKQWAPNLMQPRLVPPTPVPSRQVSVPPRNTSIPLQQAPSRSQLPMPGDESFKDF